MRNFLSNSLSLSLGATLGSQISLRVAAYTQPRPTPHQFAQWLDHPLRLRYRDPSATLGLYGCGAGLTVLDLGCDTGTFTLAMAQMVEDSGVIHAVDLQQPMLNLAQQRIAAAGLTPRVHFHCSGAYPLPLADSSIDLAVLIATFAQIPNKNLALAELARVLKPGGRLALSEELPDPAYVPPPVLRRWVEGGGLRFGGQSGSWFCYHQIYFNEK